MHRVLMNLVAIAALLLAAWIAIPAQAGIQSMAPNARVLCSSGVATTLAADTNENTAATCTIPAGAMGANGSVRVFAYWSVTNNANAKTMRVRFGGTQVDTANLASLSDRSSSMVVYNRNATNSQGTMYFMNNQSIPPGSSAAIDTTAAVNLTITGQKATAGDTMTLNYYVVELLVP